MSNAALTRAQQRTRREESNLLPHQGYRELLKVARSARNPERGKPFGNNTRLYEHTGESAAIFLHGTPVVVMRPLGTNVMVSLNHGGYTTVTTKSRMNEHVIGRVRVHQSNYIWYVTIMQPEQGWDEGITVHFRDQTFNYTIDPAGRVLDWTGKGMDDV